MGGRTHRIQTHGLRGRGRAAGAGLPGQGTRYPTHITACTASSWGKQAAAQHTGTTEKSRFSPSTDKVQIMLISGRNTRKVQPITAKQDTEGWIWTWGKLITASANNLKGLLFSLALTVTEQQKYKVSCFQKNWDFILSQRS